MSRIAIFLGAALLVGAAGPSWSVELAQPDFIRPQDALPLLPPAPLFVEQGGLHMLGRLPNDRAPRVPVVLRNLPLGRAHSGWDDF